MKTLLLIDANALIHRAFHALPPMTGKNGEAVNALYGASSILLKIWREERPDFAAALFDRPEPTFRKREYAEYKAHRPKAPNELISQIVKSRELFRAFQIKTFEVPGFEADDLIGTAASKFSGKDFKVVILTGDLDALQLVSKDRVVVKTLKTGVSKTFIYDETAVYERYGLNPAQLPDYKAMVGDPSDNIPGIQGVGPKTASLLLQKYGSLRGVYENIEKEPKLKEKFINNRERAFLYKRLSEIKKDAPIGFQDVETLKTEADPGKLLSYFDDLGFESLKQRILDNEKPREAKVSARPAGQMQGADKMKTAESGELFPQESAGQISPMGPAEFIERSGFKIGFDLKAAIKKMHKSGRKAEGPYFDLGVGFWLLNPDIKNIHPAAIFKKIFKKEWSGDNDAVLAFNFLKKKIASLGLAKIFYKIEMPLLPVLADMEETGIAVDRKRLDELKEKADSGISRLRDEIYKFAGRKINLNSPKQLSALLFSELKIGSSKIKKTPAGLMSTSEELLLGLRSAHPIIDLILQYREIFKLKSTYILPILNLIHGDGRLRTTYNQTGTATGRLSSENPNLQNIPVGGGLAGDIRSAFIASEGHTFCAFDYSQIELRILASLSGDEKMALAFKSGEDIHAATASTVFRVPLKSVTPEMRRVAKTLNFGIIYGMGAASFAKTANLKKDEAKKFIEDYFKEFKRVKEWHEKTIKEARTTGVVRNENGRIRLVPALKFGASRAANEALRAAINMPVQSLGADIIKLAMINSTKEITSKFQNNEAKLLLSIHDELLFEVRDDIIKETVAIIRGIMNSIFRLRVPLVVNVKTGKNWGELK